MDLKERGSEIINWTHLAYDLIL